MNWVVFSVLVGLVLFNFLGIGIYHYEWKHEVPHKDWHCKEFYIWTAYLFFVGIAYVVMKIIIWVINKIRGTK